MVINIQQFYELLKDCEVPELQDLKTQAQGMAAFERLLENRKKRTR